MHGARHGIRNPFFIARHPNGRVLYSISDPSGRMVLAANYLGGSVVSYPLAEDGALGEASSRRDTSAEVVCDRRRR